MQYIYIYILAVVSDPDDSDPFIAEPVVPFFQNHSYVSEILALGVVTSW